MAANDTQIDGKHYKTDKIQHWDLVIANDIPYLEAQILRYVMRHRKKHGLTDLHKAMHFLEKLIEVENDRLRVPIGRLPKCPDGLGGECDYNPNQDR
jgi:hypothetical protein